MSGLKPINDPAVLHFLLTEDLYAIKDATPANRQAQIGEGETGAAHDMKQAPKVDPTGAEGFHYLGENRKFILALVNYPEEKYLPTAEREYLEKVLSAVQVTLDDIALLNYARYPQASYAALKEFFAFDRLLLFGVRPTLLRIPGPVLPYHLGLVEGVKILAADSAEVLRPDNAKKKALWGELQRIFSK